MAPRPGSITGASYGGELGHTVMWRGQRHIQALGEVGEGVIVVGVQSTAPPVRRRLGGPST